MDLGKIDNFWQARQAIQDARKATNYRDDGRLDFDVALVAQYIHDGVNYLDLGSGTGTLTANFLDRAQAVVAVEKWRGFLDQMADHPRLQKVEADVLKFETASRFELITLFGVMNFVPSEEEDALIGRVDTMLAPGGVFIAKHQCGVVNEVEVDRYSEELGTWYHARYPHRDDEISRLSRYFDVETVDIYPSHLNRWPDTHFYAFVCRSRRES